jgi:hypothetical protein
VPECTCPEPEKPKVWLNGAIDIHRIGKVILARDLQSAIAAISSTVGNFLSILGSYRLAGRSTQVAFER